MGPQQCTLIFRWSSHSAWDPDLSNWFIILKRSLLQELCRWLEWRPLNAVRKGVCHVGLLRACNIWHLWPRQRRHYSLRLSVTRCYKYDSTDMIIWSPGKPQLRTAFGYAIQNEQFQQMSKTIQNLSVKTCKECHAPWTVSQPRELLVCLARRPLASRTMWHRAAAKRFAGFPGTAQMTKDDKSVCASESSRWHTKNI